MNCWTDDGCIYYCLDPINPNLNYLWQTTDSGRDILKNYTYKTENLIHREDGPAIIIPNDEFELTNNNCIYEFTKYWYYMGKSHRVDGPAIERSNGENYWYYHGEKIICKDNEEFLKIIKMRAFL